MSQELLEAALEVCGEKSDQRGLEPSEVAGIKRLQKLLGREVIHFVPTILPDVDVAPPDPGAFRKRVHAALANQG